MDMVNVPRDMVKLSMDMIQIAEDIINDFHDMLKCMYAYGKSISKHCESTPGYVKTCTWQHENPSAHDTCLMKW
jgi:hypothetical protein